MCGKKFLDTTVKFIVMICGMIRRKIRLKKSTGRRFEKEEEDDNVVVEEDKRRLAVHKEVET